MYVPSLRLYLHISTHHKLLVIHRAFISTGKATTAQSHAAHKASLVAARTLIKELDSGKHLNRAALWQIPYHAVSAASLIALTLFRDDAQQEGLSKARQEILGVMNTLNELGKSSLIARRGAQVLSGLLEEQARWAQDPVYRNKRKTEGGVSDVVKRFKM